MYPSRFFKIFISEVIVPSWEWMFSYIQNNCCIHNLIQFLLLLSFIRNFLRLRVNENVNFSFNSLIAFKHHTLVNESDTFTIVFFFNRSSKDRMPIAILYSLFSPFSPIFFHLFTMPLLPVFSSLWTCVFPSPTLESFHF